ncbi:MAG: tetratricopeptide repeat protein [Bryobacterales bacterium]|nr:tetratricopeptide repeat protein [Bryobacteraceae bacterium]MDW8353550.1 tetratricopeptide repeat protein [Bryobacterales bacterium]
MRAVLANLLCLASFASRAWASLEQARALYEQTRYEDAVRVLEASGDRSAAAYHLLGRCHYLLGDYKKAVSALERAVQLEPNNSTYHDWLGKAYGRRAETSSFVTAPGFATKARRSFERAVELDPGNLEALGDLFEYYLQAPGILGGGLEKAEAVAARFARLDAAEHHWALARLAEKRKDYRTAEKEYRRAAELQPSKPGRWIDLAKFLARRGRYPESEEAFERAEQAAPGSPRVWFARAATWIESGRNLTEARQLLQRYLRAELSPEDPPRREAQRLLERAARE